MRPAKPNNTRVTWFSRKNLPVRLNGWGGESAAQVAYSKVCKWMTLPAPHFNSARPLVLH